MDSGVWYKNICSWGPILAISLELVVGTSELYSVVQLLGLPDSNWVKAFNVANLFVCPVMVISVACLQFSTMNGPGFIPLRWSPNYSVGDKKYLDYCNVCCGFKAPRSHHCKSCGRCVLKLDHHCALINTCVGHKNHTTFMAVLLIGMVGLLQSIFLNSYFLKKLVNKAFLSSPRRFLPISVYTRYFVVLGIAVAVGAVFGVMVVLIGQMKGILRNRTYIEELICAKAKERRKRDNKLKPFVFPYDLGWRRNFFQVMRCCLEPVGNGYEWPVKEGCDQYSLMAEHLEQKKARQKEGDWHDSLQTEQRQKKPKKN